MAGGANCHKNARSAGTAKKETLIIKISGDTLVVFGRSLGDCSGGAAFSSTLPPTADFYFQEGITANAPELSTAMLFWPGLGALYRDGGWPRLDQPVAPKSRCSSQDLSHGPGGRSSRHALTSARR